VWGGGWLARLGVLDFAGGTVVHVNAGAAALVAALVVGGRKDYGRQAMLPHNVPFVLLGSALLYFGWFGFNAGSALGANGSAVTAFASTMLAPMACVLVRMALDGMRSGKATAVGAATGIVIGLVAITPAAGFVGPVGALLIGALAAPPSYFAIVWRARTRVDDSLDVFAGHGIGGITGALLTGVFASKLWNPAGADGLLAGNPGQVVTQAIGVASSIAYSAVGTFVILKLLGLVIALRAAPRAEGLGMDVTQHGEEAYTNGEGSILVIPDAGTVGVPAHALTPQAAAR
jgi:Amt family ammonium transporter